MERSDGPSRGVPRFRQSTHADTLRPKPTIGSERGTAWALVAAFAVFLFCGCAPRFPGNLAGQLAQWFVNPTAADTRALCKYALSAGQIDSLMELAGSQGMPRGRGRQRLVDKNGRSYSLGIYVPPTPSSNPVPLVVYLHGGVGTQKDSKGEDAYEMLAPLTDTMPLCLASPSANRDAPWWSESGLERILQAVRFMALRYDIDPDRVLLAGVSDGATGCYAAANSITGPFAGFIAISGFGGMLPSLGMELQPANLMQRPIYNVNAGQDRLYPIDQVREFIAWLARNGVVVDTKEYGDRQHGFDYREQEWGTLANLIRTWRRPARSSVNWTFVPGVPNRPDNVVGWEFSARSANLRARQRGAVLEVSAAGLRNVSLLVPGVDAHSPVEVTVGGARRAIRPSRSTALLLATLQQRCLPSTHRDQIVTIVF